MTAKQSLDERKKIVDGIKCRANVVLKSLLEVENITVDKEKSSELALHFKIDEKEYSMSVIINRERKGHWESKYVGSPGCGTSMDESPYDDYWVNDEEE